MKSTCEICWPCGCISRCDSGRTVFYCAIFFIIRNNTADQLRHSDKSALDIRSQPRHRNRCFGEDRQTTNSSKCYLLSETWQACRLRATAWRCFRVNSPGYQTVDHAGYLSWSPCFTWTGWYIRANYAVVTCLSCLAVYCRTQFQCSTTF